MALELIEFPADDLARARRFWETLLDVSLDERREEEGQHHMNATVRRYEGVDKSRTHELTKKFGESLLPRLSKVPGFSGYYLFEAGEGVMRSISFFDTSAQADESTRVAATWVRDEKLETALPNPPKISGGEVIVHKTNGLVRA